METDKYKNCNHHHELTDRHTLMGIDGDVIVANNDAVGLLWQLNSLGLRTRTHHIDREGDNAFVSIILDDDVSVEVRTVNERDATRTKYNGLKELLITWRMK